MPQYVRVAEFEADDAAIEALLDEIKTQGAPPADLPAKRLTVLADRATGTLVVAVRFDSEEDLRKGTEVLDAMSPPAGGNMRRVSVSAFEVVFDQEA